MLSSCAPTDICVACPCVAPLSYEASFEHALSAGFANGQRAMILNHHGMYAVGRDAAEGVFVATHLTQANTRARASSSCALAVYLMCAHGPCFVFCFQACEVQVRTLSMVGGDVQRVILPDAALLDLQ